MNKHTKYKFITVQGENGEVELRTQDIVLSARKIGDALFVDVLRRVDQL